VAGLDVVAVDDAQVTNPGPGQQRNQCGTGGAAPNDGNARGGKLLLPFDANRWKENLAGIPFGEIQRLHLLPGSFLVYYRDSTSTSPWERGENRVAATAPRWP